jgi:hypothetical protein
MVLTLKFTKSTNGNKRRQKLIHIYNGHLIFDKVTKNIPEKEDPF